MDDRIKKYLTWKRIGIAAGLTAFAVVLLLVIFSGSGTSRKQPEPRADGPEQVLERFYAALVSGDMDEVKSCCDTSSAVMGYVEEYVEKAAGLLEKEKGALSIVSDMLKVEVTGRKKSGETMSVGYRISLEGGEEGALPGPKERTAEMIQEEGQWKIAGITGR